MTNFVSFSQYSTYKRCKQSWKLKYVDGHKLDDSSLSTIFGSAVHRILQEWLGDVLYTKSLTYAKSIDLSSRFKTILVEEAKPKMKQTSSTGVVTWLFSREELDEYYQQGIEIIQYVQANSKKLFPTENTKLVGIELELGVDIRQNVRFTGFLDIVTQDIEEGTYTIYDLKTSKSGWTSYTKNDPIKRAQPLLYKKFFAEQLGIPIKYVNVEFVILKREVYKNSQFKIPRVSKYAPPSGTTSINKVWKEFTEFLNDCYTEAGDTISTNKTPSPSTNTCKFCPFKDRKDLCSVGINS